MFEDALMESGDRIKTKSQWWSIAAFVINGSILLVLVLWPLLHPEGLPRETMTMLLVAPPPPPAPPPPQAPVPRVKVVSEMLNSELTAPSKIPKQIKMVKDQPPPSGVTSVDGSIGGDSGSRAINGILESVGSGPAPLVKPAAPRKVAISSGVMAGNKLSGANPAYPPIAKAARIQGTVVLQATIGKTGAIENLRVISGPPMLQPSAVEAVKTWHYRPYLLNGEPVDVETTVNVVFSLGG